MIFDYFLCDAVKRDLVRECNNKLVRSSDELWVFGPVSDGVLAEILLALEMKKLVRYFKIVKSKQIIEVSKDEIEMEEDVKVFQNKL